MLWRLDWLKVKKPDRRSGGGGLGTLIITGADADGVVAPTRDATALNLNF
jgi:hypothetical protein